MWTTKRMRVQPTLRGERLILRPLCEEDAQRLGHWRDNPSPLLWGYNYGSLSPLERETWLYTKQHGRNLYFAVDAPESALIGYLGAKRINRFARSALFGIVFSPDGQSKGYGTEAMALFLEFYFNRLAMRRLDLEVNQFNERALALYRSFGFQIVSEKEEPFENQALDFSDPLLVEARPHFTRRQATWYSKLWVMRKEKR